MQASSGKSVFKRKQGTHGSTGTFFETENIYADREEIGFHHPYASDKNKLHNYKHKN